MKALDPVPGSSAWVVHIAVVVWEQALVHCRLASWGHCRLASWVCYWLASLAHCRLAFWVHYRLAFWVHYRLAWMGLLAWVAEACRLAWWVETCKLALLVQACKLVLLVAACRQALMLMLGPCKLAFGMVLEELVLEKLVLCKLVWQLACMLVWLVPGKAASLREGCRQVQELRLCAQVAADIYGWEDDRHRLCGVVGLVELGYSLAWVVVCKWA